MTWSDLLAEVGVLEACGPGAIELREVRYDSRKVHAGDVFVAMRGGATDGNRFVKMALELGAGAVVTDSRTLFDELRASHPQLPLAWVEHGRRALSEIAAALYGHPERVLKISAVTGTNGKTTTAWLLEQLLRSVGRKTCLIGTIETHVGDEVRASEHTTPEASDLLRVFADAVAAGATEAVMEISSHALDQERVWGLPIDVAIFTNLTQDHLDYHGTMERYAEAKAKLFRGVGAPPPRVAVIHWVKYSELMEQAASGCERMIYGLDLLADFRAEEVQIAAGYTNFLLECEAGTGIITSPLTGRVNVENLLAAACAAMARGLSLEEIAAAARNLRQVPGRFQVLAGGEALGFTVVVDYAHTDDALRNLMGLARELVKAAGGRVITLFGCGGDRDRSKRPKMGRAAGEGSDLVVVTSDNPRSEEPMAIIDEIVVGIVPTGVTYLVEEDRASAIAIAIRAARAGDLVLIAGKGHEKVQIFADETVEFDDVAVAAEILRELAAG